MARSSSRKKKTSIIPVLLTLGIIGWGFFAIDRLISKEDSFDEIQSNNVSKKKQYKPNSLRHSFLSSINGVLGDEKTKPKLKEKPKAKTETKSLDTTKTRINNEVEIETEKDRITNNENLSRVKLYFYQLNGDKAPILRSSYRKINKENQIRQISKALRLLIQGPIGSELLKDYANSFTNKPRLLSIRKEASNLALNFNSWFGQGVSFQMQKLQIKQLVYTATSFSGISSITLKINNRAIKSIGGDGLLLPNRITRSNF